MQYRYRLEGFDKDWVQSPSFHRTAAYTNLPAGNYRLLIRASGRLGDSPSAELEIPIIALAAWYESSWFFLLERVAAFLGVFLIVRLRTAVIRKRQAEPEKEVAASTADLAKNQAELVRANEKLTELATRDPLTGAFNRRQFMAMAEGEIEQSRRTGRPFTLLMIDVDHFKSINDRYGHQAGDEVLRKLVAQLSVRLRKTDLIARYRGEELVVLLADTGLGGGLQLAERLRARVANSPVQHGENMIPVTVSIGAAEGKGEESIAELLKRQDGALCAAKNAGRDRVASAGSVDRRKGNIAVD